MNTTTGVDVETLAEFGFDRSQARLRLPVGDVDETLRLANNLSFEGTSVEKVADLDLDLVDSLTEAGVMTDEVFDPMAADILETVNQASLVVTVDLRYGPDSSQRTIWATPRSAVISNQWDETTIEFAPAEVSQLPFVLSQAMLARSPRFVGASPISISTDALTEDETDSLDSLVEAGLSDDQAKIVHRFQGADVRRWRITTRWSTDVSEQDFRELRGIDADVDGQWLVAMTGSRDEGRGQMTFTPQAHGDIMRSLRAILPKVWFGTPLKPPAV